MPEVTPWSIALAGLLLLSGETVEKGEKRIDPKRVRRNIRFLRNFAEARAASAKVVRIRDHDDSEQVRLASCELIRFLDRVDTAYGPLCGGATFTPEKITPAA